jgi:D-ribose pyranose/furanose isomerase RbsD
MSETNFSSCANPEPFIRLGAATKVPKLRYSLPQSSCLESKGYIPLDIPSAWFKPDPSIGAAPTDNFWDVIASPGVDVNMVKGAFSNMLVNTVQTEPVVGVVGGPSLVLADGIGPIISGLAGGEATFVVNPATENTVVAGQTVSVLAEQAISGILPVIYDDSFGRKRVRYQPKPKSIKPTISIVEHYRTCHYLGDYGAGRTLKTFSLLPGEKTKISIRSYKQVVSQSRITENVLDSFSEESSNELEQLIEQETHRKDVTDSTSIKSSEIGGGLNIQIPLPKGIKLGLGGGGGVSKSSTTNSVREASVRALNSSISKQASRSSSARNIEVNTEESITQTSEEENTVIREIENINYSRTLNFVFRQLLQEYISVTYLEDISIVFSNGYPESRRVIKLSQLQEFLEELILAPHVDDVRDAILAELSSIYDHTGTRQCFIEKRLEEIYNWETPAVLVRTIEYFRKKADLLQTYDSDPGDPDSFEVTVPGIILDVTKRILRTDSLIVEALLGQGEALDCYNMQRQWEDTVRVKLENQEREQRLEIINLQDTPAAKADKYKKVFTDCCDVPQSGCCGCFGSSTPQNPE